MGIGFSLIFAGQDYQAFSDLSALLKKFRSENFVNCWNLLRASFTTAEMETSNVMV